MNITETQELLKQISAIDKRQINPETIQAWHQIVGHLSFDVAIEAHKMARKDLSVNYLEPRHIIGWAKEALSKLERLNPKPAEPEKQATPEPLCKDHNKRITTCGTCCSKLAKLPITNPEQLDRWAKENIYA
jgi:ADP-heptose:LPS heptosyltransferase